MSKACKKITLPSGAVCTVRKISGNDFIHAGLSPVIAELRKASGKAKKVDAGGDPDQRALEHMVKITEMVLLRCCGAIRYPDGSVVRIVNKPFDECSDLETTIEMLDQEDANAIVSEVNKLSGLTKEAASAAAPFPGEQEIPDGPAPGSQGLRPAAD